MKPLLTVLAATLLLWTVPGVQADPPNGISAVVHDAVITSDEVEMLTEQTAEVLSRDLRNEPKKFEEEMAKARKQNLEKRVDRQLILHDFKVAGYNLPESVIDELVQERIRARYGDRRTLTKTLQDQGLTYEKFRQQVREQFIVEALRQKNVSSEIIISPHKVETYYQAHREDFKQEDRVKLRMIVLNKSNDPDKPVAHKLAEEIVGKLKEGATFQEMANIYSQRSPRNAGAEWFVTSRLRKELADVAVHLKTGERSEIIDMADACYLIYAEERTPEHYQPLSEVRVEIEKDLRTEEQARLERQWIERLRKKTFVRYFE